MGVLWSIWLILIRPGYQDILVSVSGGALSPPRVPPYQTWLPVTPANKCADWRDQGQPRYTIYGQLAVVGAVPVPHHIEHLVQLHPIGAGHVKHYPCEQLLVFLATLATL